MRKILFKSVLVASLSFGSVLFGASVAQAGDIADVFEAETVVFEKSFDGKQGLTSVRFEKLLDAESAGSGGERPGMSFMLKMKFKDSKKTFEATGSCFADAEVMDCRIGCDGSGFTLKVEKDETVALINTEGFQLNGCMKDSSAEVRKFKVEGDDPVYSLGKPKQKG